MSRLRNLPLLILAFGLALLIRPADAPAGLPVLTQLESVRAWGTQGNDDLATDGDYTIAGAPYQNAAKVLVRSGQSWSPQQTLTAPGIVANDEFGHAVDIDGSTAVVGVPRHSSYTGSAYVFVRSGTTWTLQATLDAADRLPGDQFGYSVAVDGDRIIVGAPGQDEYGSQAGMVYVFERVGTTWTQTAKIRPASAPADFGWRVAIDADTVVASPGTWIFVRSGAQWIQQGASLTPNLPLGWPKGGPLDLQQNTLVVGQPWLDLSYVFTRTGSTWSRTATLTGDPGTNCGASVSISGDYLGVGAPWDDTVGNNSGAIYSYHRTGSTWTPVFKGVVVGEMALGWGVAVDGSRLLSTAIGHDVHLHGIPPDTTPPVTTALGIPSGWVRDNVSLTLAASDAGSGVTSTFYARDAELPSTYSMPFTISREGTCSIRYWSVDASGNIEPSKTAYVRIDRSAPDRVSVELSAWLPTGCTLSWPAGRDDLSGVAYYRVYRNGSMLATTSALSWSDDGLAPSTPYQYRVSAVDVVGNESEQSAVVRYVTPNEQGEPSVVDVPATGGTAVPIPGGGSVTFDYPGTGGQLEIAPVAENHEPANFRIVRGAYYDIHPNFTFAGDAYVTLPYDPAAISGKAENLKLFHWKDGGWEDITVSVDKVHHTITGRTTSFSDFALGEDESLGSGSPVVGVPASSGWSIGLAALFMAFVTERVSRGKRSNSYG